MFSPVYSLLLILPAICVSADKVKVTVFYESLCPDSQKFINNQLYPTFTSPLVLNMDLNLIPFGNAEVNATGLFCQHGPVECYGNRVQACAIEKVPSPDKKVGFINCLLKKAFDKKPTNESNYDDFIKECGPKWTGDATSEIKNCANNMTESNPLIYKYGNMTKSANPPITGVPTTFFNDKSSKDINDAATKDFSKTLCSYIGGTKPNECNSGKGSASDIVSSAVLIGVAVFLSRLP